MKKSAKSIILKFQSPQWGSNSKVGDKLVYFSALKGFSPRNGEVILKAIIRLGSLTSIRFSPRNGEVILKSPHISATNKFFSFQSPQWGSNSKEIHKLRNMYPILSFSPRNGEVILKYHVFFRFTYYWRFSPRNGEVILKKTLKFVVLLLLECFSPRNGEVILK